MIKERVHHENEKRTGSIGIKIPVREILKKQWREKNDKGRRRSESGLGVVEKKK